MSQMYSRRRKVWLKDAPAPFEGADMRLWMADEKSVTASVIFSKTFAIAMRYLIILRGRERLSLETMFGGGVDMLLKHILDTRMDPVN